MSFSPAKLSTKSLSSSMTSREIILSEKSTSSSMRSLPFDKSAQSSGKQSCSRPSSALLSRSMSSLSSIDNRQSVLSSIDNRRASTPRREFVPLDKAATFDKASFVYISPYGNESLSASRRSSISSDHLKCLLKRRRQSLPLPCGKNPFIKANFHYVSPYGEFYVDVNGRGGRGYGRKIQTSPTFDKKMFLEEKESVVRRNPIEQVEATVLDVIDLLPKDMSPEDLLALNDLFENDASLHHFCVGIESLYRSPKVASKTRNPSSTSPMKALQRKKSTDNILRGLRTETSTDAVPVPAVVVDVIVTEVKRPTTPTEKVGKEVIVQKPSSR